MHIMIDLETLSTRMDAAIVSIGAVRFDETGIAPFPYYQAITIDSNVAAGRHISGDTLAWWIGQDAKAKAVFTDPAANTLNHALLGLSIWLSHSAAPEDLFVWGNGANFDISILQSAYETADQPIPWNFRNVRCLRTIRNLAGASYVARPEIGTAHNALDDPTAQAMWLIAAWNDHEIGRLEGQS